MEFPNPKQTRCLFGHLWLGNNGVFTHLQKSCLPRLREDVQSILKNIKFCFHLLVGVCVKSGQIVDSSRATNLNNAQRSECARHDNGRSCLNRGISEHVRTVCLLFAHVLSSNFCLFGFMKESEGERKVADSLLTSNGVSNSKHPTNVN